MTMKKIIEEQDWLKIGTYAKFRSNQEGFQGAWFIVQIIEHYYKKNGVYHQVSVKYKDFTKSSEPGNKKIQEIAKMNHL